MTCTLTPLSLSYLLWEFPFPSTDRRSLPAFCVGLGVWEGDTGTIPPLFWVPSIPRQPATSKHKSLITKHWFLKQKPRDSSTSYTTLLQYQPSFPIDQIKRTISAKNSKIPKSASKILPRTAKGCHFSLQEAGETSKKTANRYTKCNRRKRGLNEQEHLRVGAAKSGRSTGCRVEYDRSDGWRSRSSLLDLFPFFRYLGFPDWYGLALWGYRSNCDSSIREKRDVEWRTGQRKSLKQRKRSVSLKS